MNIREFLGTKGCEDGVHRFEPRYDLKAPQWMDNVEEIKGEVWEAYEKTYVFDICVRCGKTIRRDETQG